MVRFLSLSRRSKINTVIRVTTARKLQSTIDNQLIDIDEKSNQIAKNEALLKDVQSKLDEERHHRENIQ